MESIDGTTLEGGGGLIRAALTYSSILNKKVHVFSVRANRPNTQGLQPGHTSAVHAIEQLTSAAVEGNQPYSPELTFAPHKNQEGKDWKPPSALEVDLEGSASIFLVAVLPYLLFARLAATARGELPADQEPAATRLTVRAGMLVLNAPSIFYMRQVFLPTLRSIGITAEHIELTDEYQQGWYSEGSKPINQPGKIVAVVKPLTAALPGFIFPRRGPVVSVRATVHVPARARDLFAAKVEEELEQVIPPGSSNVEVITDVMDSFPEDQYHLLLTATTSAPEAYFGYELIYPQEKRFPSRIEGDDEQIALHLSRACIRGLWRELQTGHSVDEHMEDILTVYATMAKGFSSTVTKEPHGVLVEGFALDSPALGKSTSVYKQYQQTISSPHQVQRVLSTMWTPPPSIGKPAGGWRSAFLRWKERREWCVGKYG